MASSEKLLKAVRSNWWLNALGLVLSYCASIVLVRSLSQELYAQYAAVLAIVWLATLLFEAGANSGLTRYLHEAGAVQSRGTFYRAMRRRRWALGAVMSLSLILLGPLYARHGDLPELARQPLLFAGIAVAVVASMTKALASYGLVALFEMRTALVWEQIFVVGRAVLLATIALVSGELWQLVLGLAVINVIEAIGADARLRRLIGHESNPVEPSLLSRAQVFGFFTMLDKGCAGVGSGAVLLLLLAPFHDTAELALLALAFDLAGKVLSLTVMPMGNLVGPYLSRVSDDAAAQGAAVGRVIKVSSLLYCLSVGGAMLVLPEFVPLVYGPAYAGTVLIALIVLPPMALENWVRGTCSPALLRAGRYRELAGVNVVQVGATLAAIWFVREQPLPTALAAILAVRGMTSALNLLRLATLVPLRAYAVAAQAVPLAIFAVLPWFCVEPMLPPVAWLILKGFGFVTLYGLGVRYVILRDADTLQLAHRLAGRSVLANLLPPLPSAAAPTVLKPC